jgi:hypothetical protein
MSKQYSKGKMKGSAITGPGTKEYALDYIHRRQYCMIIQCICKNKHNAHEKVFAAIFFPRRYAKVFRLIFPLVLM